MLLPIESCRTLKLNPSSKIERLSRFYAPGRKRGMCLTLHCACWGLVARRWHSLRPRSKRFGEQEKSMAGAHRHIDIGQRLLSIIATFHHHVRNENHGIKERNLLSLLLPIGIAHGKIDPAFLADMESFGPRLPRRETTSD